MNVRGGCPRLLAAALGLALSEAATLSRTTTASSAADLAHTSRAAKGLRYPGRTWQRAGRPDDLHWSSQGLLRARRFADSLDTAAVLLVEDGAIVAEWGDLAERFNVHSIRKSLLSVLFGTAVKEGCIKLTQTLAELGIDDEPPLTYQEKQARVVDLLTARSGVYHQALYETAEMRTARPRRGSHAPGEFFYYNNWDYNALGTILEKATGDPLVALFRTRLAKTLEMEDFKDEDLQYVAGRESRHRAYVIRMSARDLARVGLLLLSEGSWRGEQVVPREWVAESTTAHVDAGNCGYGYMWWVSLQGRLIPGIQLANGAFSSSGFGGHWLVVIPDRKLVVVHRVDTDHPGKQVSDTQFGVLLSLILDAKR